MQNGKAGKKVPCLAPFCESAGNPNKCHTQEGGPVAERESRSVFRCGHHGLGASNCSARPTATTTVIATDRISDHLSLRHLNSIFSGTAQSYNSSCASYFPDRKHDPDTGPRDHHVVSRALIHIVLTISVPCASGNCQLTYRRGDTIKPNSSLTFAP